MPFSFTAKGPRTLPVLYYRRLRPYRWSVGWADITDLKI
jgi:hypothetical protein